MDTDIAKFITQEDLSVFKRCESSCSAIKFLGQVSDKSDTTVSQQQNVLVRDFLITKVIMASACRSGVISNMTLGEFRKCCIIDDHRVISVNEHEKGSNAWSCKFVLNCTLFSWLAIYSHFIRTKISKNNDDASVVFISWKGEPLTSGHMFHSLQTMWKNAGLEENITCTTVQKTAASAMHQQHPITRASLADLMSHRLSTATKSYRFPDSWVKMCIQLPPPFHIR